MRCSRGRALLLLVTVIAMSGPAAARTVEGVVRDLGPAARARLAPRFRAAGAAYPPRAVTLLVLKEERVLELWAEGASPRLVHRYPVTAASGVAGPKLRQGDLQVPEGVYRVLWLNPASSYHLSMKLDYPNAFDRAHARRDGRTDLGGDIFVHGRAVSIGCVALGDPAIEELFVLAADVGTARVKAVIAPRDLRAPSARDPEVAAPWASELYALVRREMSRLRAD
ncbi:MAG: L,D-transpeptidase family protein [Vicinamibacteria bacterium]